MSNGPGRPKMILFAAYVNMLCGRECFQVVLPPVKTTNNNKEGEWDFTNEVNGQTFHCN